MDQSLSQLAKKIEEIGPDGLASVIRLLDIGGGATQVDPSNFADLTDLAALAGKIGPNGLDQIRSLLDAGVGCTSAQTVEEFLTDNRISRATFYVEVNAGRLRTFKVGARRLVTREAATEWRRRLERDTAKEAAA